MSASLTDLLTTQKNGVVAINQLARQGAVAVLLGRGAMPLAYAVFYTCPKGVRTYVTDIDICNTASAAATVYVSLVPSNSTPGAGNAIFYATPIPANSTLQWTGAQIINPGDTIQVYASATTCTINISGGQSS